jgi:hypothetical protein
MIVSLRFAECLRRDARHLPTPLNVRGFISFHVYGLSKAMPAGQRRSATPIEAPLWHSAAVHIDEFLDLVRLIGLGEKGNQDICTRTRIRDRDRPACLRR